ncbi:DNA polymerase I [Solimonas terrae]|uniref:DNA polymerase I n=1 Tax=Solimonas terrae TaxID=1396819 RepID=A0A6M2BW27_9GAMM|nr:DNA polymerase I [Solimonas terrae]NGY06411.1 DNA polymerase I [Solimonas terrae]
MSDGPHQPLILIDGSSWLFRAFFALPPLTNARGEPTGAVYGMGNMLRKLLKDYAPEEIAVIFDAPGTNFRHELYAEYKANRDETPQELKQQYPAIVEMIEGLGLPVIAVPDVEADDVIGTFAQQAAARGQHVLIVTGDKDMAQLVGGGVKLLDTMKNRTLDRDGVIERFGVPPECIVDYLALMGDSVDNIPGVPSVGPKTAAKWLNEYGSLDGVVQNADAIKGKVGEKLRAHLAQLPLSRQLATIRCDVGLPIALEALKPQAPDLGKLVALYTRLGFGRWVDELRQQHGELPRQDDTGPARAAPATPTTVTEKPAVAPPPDTGEPTLVLPAPPDTPSPATVATLVVDEAGFATMLTALQAAELICVDTETDSLDSNQANLVGIAFAVEAGQGWYVPLAHDYLGAPPQLPRDWVLTQLKPLLEDAARPKLGQHIKYDLNVFARHGVRLAGIAHDTMLQSFVLDAAGNRHDMDTLAEKYLGHKTVSFTDIAGKGKNQLTFNQIALDAAADYSAEDADITLRLHQTLYPCLGAMPALHKVYQTIEMPLVPVLAEIEQTGVKIDVPLLGKISLELAERMTALQREAFTEAGTEFNLGSPKQLGQILYEQLKLPVLGKTPKGEPSTAEDVLESLAAEHRLPRLILDWRALQKLRSTYTEQLPLAVNPKTGRIHTSYHQAGAATGRMSSSDPNLQNIPVRNAEGRRIRQAFIAEPGNALVSIDYSQIELRLMAHFSGDARLQAAFRDGLDIHQATAAEVFGLPLDDVPAERRRAAKAINFGLIYGMSAFGLARQLGIPRGEAQDYIERFFGRYPGVKHFMDTTRIHARETGYVETLFGRRLYLPNIAASNQAQRQYAERTAINAPLQGTAADLIKLAMVDVARFLNRRAPDVRMIMQVHDELVFEGPESRLRELAPVIAGRMVRISRLQVPLVADFGFGSEWDSAHSGSGHASSGT